MLTENSILALLLSPKPTFSPTCTFHTFLPFFLSIFHFIAPAALNHIFQHQIQHQRPFHVFPLFLSMLGIFQQNTRFQHYQGLYSAKIVFFSRTLTLSRFRFRRAALFGTSGFSNSIFRLNICCSERMPALVINTLHRLRHTVLRISASKRDQPVRHSTSHQQHTSEGHLLRKHRLISPCEVRKPDPVPIRLSSFKQTKVRRFQRLMLFTGTAIMIPVLVFAIALAHTVNSASARVHLFEKLGKSLENAPELYSL